MPTPGLLLHPLSSSSMIRPSNSIHFDLFPSKRRKYHNKSLTCKASSSSTSSFSVTDFDLYDLLGIDSTSNQSQIKTAYRSLQKKCHPDIAGPSGHDMAIILNDVYSILSDPASRAVYDEEQAKMAEFKGYSGKPIYSRWFGSESEERAVFVDEVKCVGCLKCALVAEKTFAIESVYGRARVVAQWADPEDKILDAVEACPVDCISMVERSNLATLEFLMSKQPRGNVGAPVGKGMVDVKKFQSKLQQAKNNESIPDPRETAFHTIRSISNWFYWQSPIGGEQGGSLVPIVGKSSPFNTEKLRDAAAAAKQSYWAPSNGARKHKDDTVSDKQIYWTPPAEPIGPVSAVFENLNSTAERPKSKPAPKKVRVYQKDDEEPRKPYGLRWTFPLVIATFASTIVRLQVQGESNVGVEQHMVAGPLPLEIVNSPWLQAILAGCTWYLVAFVSVGFVRALINRRKM